MVAASTGNVLCRVVSFAGKQWGVVDPLGRYDASDPSELAGLHWAVNAETIDLKQLKDHYYEPNLLRKFLHDEEVRNVEALPAVNLFPLVDLGGGVGSDLRLRVRLANRGGGLGPVRVLVNGKELSLNTRGETYAPDQAVASFPVDLTGAPIVPGEDNVVEVYAWDAKKQLSSRGTRSVFKASGEKPQPKDVQIWGIVGGISDYATDSLHLTFSAKDAVDMHASLQLAALGLLGSADKVHLTLLSSAGGLPPTKENFRKAFEAVRKAKPWDIFILYLAGHGVSYSGSAEGYAYLTKEAQSTDVSSEDVRKLNAITSDELAEWIRAIPALKQVMILDTCAAGAARSKLVETRVVTSDQIRAIETLKDRTGFHILMGSAADAVSYEASLYGQGLLTWALLEGMRGAALQQDQVDVSRLFQHAATEVPALAQNIGGVQTPIVSQPKGTTFSIGLLNEVDRGNIRLELPKTPLLPPRLFNRVENFDSLELERAVQLELRAYSPGSARGPAGVLYFGGVDDFPGGIRPSGAYTVNGTQVKVDLVLVKDHKPWAELPPISGTTVDTAELAKRIAAAVIAAAGKEKK